MARDIPALRAVADYQFGGGAGGALFPAGGEFEVRRSTGGRPRQVHADGARLVSLGTDGRFTLGVAGGERLLAGLSPPAARVVVGEESEPYVGEGRNAFAKFVRGVDPAIRPGDEVAVVRAGDDGDCVGATGDSGPDVSHDLLAVGRAELSATAMAEFETGVAVKVREGAQR